MLSNAGMEPYRGRLAALGYGDEQMEGLKDAGDALEDADLNQNLAVINAMRAASRRNEAWAALCAWLPGSRRAVLADRRDLIKMLYP